MLLGVHELIALNQDESVESAYNRTVDLVQQVEAMGYHRYWFAEHHNSPNHASVAPELLAAYLAGQTGTIRLGTGGTMIMHYSALKVAEDFKTLSAMAPGRIDIGIGRAPGSGPKEFVALAEGRRQGFDDLYDKIEVLLAYLADQPAPSFYGETQAMPKAREQVEAWLLGSSGQSAVKAGELGLGYSFAKSFGIPTSPQVFQTYRDHFVPGPLMDEPRVMVAYSIIVADSDEEADYLAKPILLSNYYLQAGKLLENMDPERVKDYNLKLNEEAFFNQQEDNRFIIKGSPAKVQEILAQEQEALGFDEVIVSAPIYDHQARIKSYRYLTEIAGELD